MALTSPGVEVNIIDESQYLPAAPTTVPLLVVATAQNKANAAGSGVASGTIASNANKLYRITSQRDLTSLFGNPFFYKTTGGTSIHGYELNEYGLFAAYSVLGLTNLCYILRADIDLASLVGRTSRPTGESVDGTYWLDTANSSWGIFEFNQSTGKFTNKVPLFVMEAGEMAETLTGRPATSVGNIGDYAISMVTTNSNYANSSGVPTGYSTHWYKNKNNTWVELGSVEWRKSWPAVQGSAQATTLTPSGACVINGVSIVVGANPNNTLVNLEAAINAAGIPYVSAKIVNSRLELYSEIDQPINIQTVGSSTLLTELGISIGTYNSPVVSFGTNAQQPQWRVTDSNTHPTGSVWVKTNSANGGQNLVFGQYNTSIGSFVNKNCVSSSSDQEINSKLDSTGGQNIEAGTLYAQYSSDTFNFVHPLRLFRRSSSGPSVFVGGVVNPVISANATFTVKVSIPGNNQLSSSYTVTMPASPATHNAYNFTAAWTAAGIPHTTATVASSGAIVLTHTSGGIIILDDGGAETSAVTQAGFGVGLSSGAKHGPYKNILFTNVTSGTGAAIFAVNTEGYNATFSISSGGSGTSSDAYTVGQVLTVTGANPLNSNYKLKVTEVDADGKITDIEVISGYATPRHTVQLSKWESFNFIPNEITPSQYPSNETKWYYSVANQADIMTNVGGEWKGYKMVSYDLNGLPKAAGTPSTDDNGPIMSVSEPVLNSSGGALAYGDLWIDTSPAALENYPVISRWQNKDDLDQWVLIDNADQTTENGIVFADARWGTNGSVDVVEAAIPSIRSLLVSNYVDLDAPDPTLYPPGTLLFNTRRSGYNVKEYRVNYFNSINFPEGSLPSQKSTWVSISGLKSDGSPYMGRKAQRAMVVKAMKTAISTNIQIREEDTFFNLIATPGYPELQPDMITLNNDRGQSAYIIGDTPMRLAPTGGDIYDWAANVKKAAATGEDGLVTRNTYMGIYYPCGITTDLTGSDVVVPASHMILRTFIYNDNVAYPWFAPAGQRRGIVDNASNIGYINSETGEFNTTKNRVEIRNIQYSNFINPIAYFTNIGILNYGNKNSFDSQNSLDRTNVARLVCYLRYQLQRALRPFIFEQNDTVTRNEARGVVQTLLADILAKRGIYDYVVVCDETNNTPARIDRNELWIDLAIEPAKAVEFIYVPVRLLNTGEISGL